MKILPKQGDYTFETTTFWCNCHDLTFSGASYESALEYARRINGDFNSDVAINMAYMLTGAPPADKPGAELLIQPPQKKGGPQHTSNPLPPASKYFDRELNAAEKRQVL